MSRTSSFDYGSNRVGLWYHGLRDRLRGDHARANARWGYLRPPQGRGKLVWVKAGATRSSVRVAVELLRAIRERRLDVRLVLTFERDYPDLLEERVEGLRKTGLGYGPSDAPRAVRRTFERMQPFALICVDHGAGPNTLREAQRRGVHTVAYLTEPGSETVEAAYPLDRDQARRWERTERAGHVAPAADPLAQLVESQVEPTFRALVRGEAEPALAWAHVDDERMLGALREAWRASASGKESILFASSDRPAVLTSVPQDATVRRLSEWDRQPIAAGTLVIVDEPRWSPALAVSSDAIYIAGSDRFMRWQALAGGMPVCFSKADYRPSEAPEALPADVSPAEFLALWSAYLADPMRARRLGDAGRRRFWEERRRSADVVEDLLQRVYDW